MEPVGLVELDREHPGFRDPIYRARRNEIADLALRWARDADSPDAPAPEVTYTDIENGVWATALRDLGPLHARFACREFHDSWPLIGFDATRIPSFQSVNRRLFASTGFRLEPVAGLASPTEFMGRLARGEFLATQYVRHHSAPLYTPEPDVLHELIGHAALLANPTFAELNRLFGEATLRAAPNEVAGLIRAYWFTLEFGVIGTPGDYRVIGAGLLSSFGELARFEVATEKRPLDMRVIKDTPFDPTDYQNVLFVAQSMDHLVHDLSSWLRPIAGR